MKETQRLRLGLAIETGDEDFYGFIANNPDERISYVTSLKSKLRYALFIELPLIC